MTTDNTPPTGPHVVDGPLGRLKQALLRPSARYSVGALLLGGAFIGWALTWGVGVGVEAVSTNAYCTSCHEMQAFVLPDHQQSPHHINAAGVRADCSDCHPATHYALKDLIANWRGTIATRELYEAKRLELAGRVWTRMEKSNSAACRDCHSHAAMDAHEQSAEAAAMMAWAVEEGTRTCVTCHKGVAHSLPEGWDTRPRFQNGQ